ncbi:hypothetical protein [Streptomyces sp. NPDC001970]
MTTYEGWEISEELLDHLGALSIGTPDLDTPQAKAVLDDATEAAAGAVAYAAYYPHGHFQVFLDHVNFGTSYDAGSEGDEQSVTAYQWLDAFCLAILAGKTEHHGEAFHYARAHLRKDATGQPRRPGPGLPRPPPGLEHPGHVPLSAAPPPSGGRTPLAPAVRPASAVCVSCRPPPSRSPAPGR